ncbi:hypothetical protein [Legionella spiritensis]|uniref:Transmembrane protein n=1 Tax=Legionella spiritensis TaxID=452 RepID=A0A0W0Z5Y3_LEGSP|nr:hypothetical protein [Legionella spiritensis]KTD64537.1 hypothetical protein Lspi_1344 [Legionella spiritensis]SNV29883.1 Uncharacterised protein [Legionella spiritensis]
MRVSRCLWQGAISGIIAGIVFAFFLYMGGMLETLGSMINMPTKTGGFLVHAIVSIVSGIAFVLIFGWLIHSWAWAIIMGLLFGFGMWVAGPMTFLPYFSAGEPLFSKWNIAAIQQNIPPLVGHLVYGFVLGVVYYAFKRHRK